MLKIKLLNKLRKHLQAHLCHMPMVSRERRCCISPSGTSQSITLCRVVSWMRWTGRVPGPLVREQSISPQEQTVWPSCLGHGQRARPGGCWTECAVPASHRSHLGRKKTITKYVKTIRPTHKIMRKSSLLYLWIRSNWVKTRANRAN